MRTRGPKAWTKWRELVAEQERSGQSAAVFCRARGLSPSHFFAWKKRLILAGPHPFVEQSVVDADCVVIITDHKNVDYAGTVRDARLIVDTRNALKKFSDPKIFRL